MAQLIIDTPEGIKIIELGMMTRTMLRFDDGSEMTLHTSGHGLELRLPRLNRRLVVRPNTQSSIFVSTEKDFE
jgi:hypothetical protein